MPRRTTPAAIAGITAALVLAGCASSDTDTAASGSAGSGAGASIVATTTIWGDITRQIVECAGAGQVTTLMPVGADPHDYAPSSQDVAAMVGADLVVANGLGLEEGLQKSIESAQQDGANMLEVAPLLDPIPFGGEGEEAHASGEDPHVWLDVTRAGNAATLIGAELTQMTGNAAYAQCGEDLQAELTTLNAEVGATLATVPEDARVLVTD
ncbi:MAG TPA: metal ABC transporter substrate-binding protein, partial [Candidatus Limnocylindrales bacterium]|nr:metal ABC transporter substrate-binding protein [Candidatus Limnocylindrales bacterium]